MSQARAMAALRLENCPGSLTASVVGITESSIDLLLSTAPAPPCRLAPGRPALVDIATSKRLMRCEGVVGTVDGPQVTVRTRRRPVELERRDDSRRDLRLAMVYRQIRPGGSYGAWRSGWTRDISLGGIGIETEEAVSTDQLVEVQFIIPLTDDAFMAGHRIRTAGTVVHARPGSSGWTRLGIRFTRVLPVDRLRILRLVDPTSAGAPGGPTRRSTTF